jgi:hypothetical protein
LSSQAQQFQSIISSAARTQISPLLDLRFSTPSNLNLKYRSLSPSHNIIVQSSDFGFDSVRVSNTVCQIRLSKQHFLCITVTNCLCVCGVIHLVTAFLHHAANAGWQSVRVYSFRRSANKNLEWLSLTHMRFEVYFLCMRATRNHMFFSTLTHGGDSRLVEVSSYMIVVVAFFHAQQCCKVVIFVLIIIIQCLFLQCKI